MNIKKKKTEKEEKKKVKQRSQFIKSASRQKPDMSRKGKVPKPISERVGDSVVGRRGHAFQCRG